MNQLQAAYSPRSLLVSAPSPLAKPSTIVEANIVLLGATFVAAFENSETEIQILIQPTDAHAPYLSIQDMVDQVTSLIHNVDPKASSIDKSTIEAQLNGVVSSPNSDSILDDISICLKQVFLYIKKQKNVQGEPNANANSLVEYAIDVELKCNIMPDFKLFNVDTISFAFWNTQRQSVLDRMELKHLSELLGDCAS